MGKSSYERSWNEDEMHIWEEISSDGSIYYRLFYAAEDDDVYDCRKDCQYLSLKHLQALINLLPRVVMEIKE